MNGYLSLPDDMTFQKRPSGATLSRRTPAQADERQRFNKAVNMDGARLLELCGGVSTLAEIVGRFNRAYPGNTLTEETAAAFFGSSVGQGLLVVNGEKRACLARFTGSYEHFYPQHSTIELTDQCNYKCAHCYRGSSPQSGKHIDLEKCKQYIQDLWESGGTVLELTGGEPLLYKHFFEVLDFAYPKMDLIGILTNGYYLQEEVAERLLKYKSKIVFNISIDSHRAEFHDKFRGKEGALARTTHAMELLGKHGFSYRAAMSVSKENYFDIEDTLKLSKKLGAKLFGMAPVVDIGRGEELCETRPTETDPEFIRKIMDYERKIRDEHGNFLHLVTEDQAKEIKTSNCGLIHRSVTVGPDGEIRPCVMFEGGTLKIGNIYRQSFKEIFEGGLGLVFSKLHGPKPELCGDCKHLPYCKNCPMKGVKMAMKVSDCRWAKATGILKYITAAPAPRVCGNAQEPNC